MLLNSKPDIMAPHPPLFPEAVYMTKSPRCRHWCLVMWRSAHINRISVDMLFLGRVQGSSAHGCDLMALLLLSDLQVGFSGVWPGRGGGGVCTRK